MNITWLKGSNGRQIPAKKSNPVYAIRCCAAASLFAHVLALENVSTIVTIAILGLFNNKWQFCLLITGFLFIVGMVIDTPAAVLILSPLPPITEQFGINRFLFGVS